MLDQIVKLESLRLNCIIQKSISSLVRENAKQITESYVTALCNEDDWNLNLKLENSGALLGYQFPVEDAV